MVRTRLLALVAGLALVAACAPTEPEVSASALRAGTDDPLDPAVVALVFAAPPIRLRCTCTMIAEHVALTAAHCIADADATDYEVLSSASLADGTRSRIVATVAHPDYDGSPDHDLALLLLEGPPSVAPLDLLAEPPSTGPARLVGFGLTDPAASDDDRRREGTSSITSVLPSSLVLGPAPSLPCNGDSGGPVLVSTPGGERIAAVVSQGDEACLVSASATRVDAALDTFILPALDAWAPASVALGERCLYDEHCESAVCTPALDDASLRFCSRSCSDDRDCGGDLACLDGLCRHPVPSPGAVGAACASTTDCARGECLEPQHVCSVRCVSGRGDCPAALACTHLGGVDFYCLAPPAPSGCSIAGPGAHAPGAAAFVSLLAAATLVGKSRRRR